MSNVDYNNLEGVVSRLDILLVSVVGDRIILDVSSPGCDVWFLCLVWFESSRNLLDGGGEFSYLRCLTQDGVRFLSAVLVDSSGVPDISVDCAGGVDWSVSFGGGLFWADIGVRVGEFASKMIGGGL